MQNLKPPILAGFGNPLLDICVKLKDTTFYKKYNLTSDGQKEVTASELESIYSYFKKENYDFLYCAGGCAQNTLRVFQWIIKAPNYSIIFGGIGNDEQGMILRNKVEHDGVITKDQSAFYLHQYGHHKMAKKLKDVLYERYERTDTHSTGTCIAIINGTERSLVAHLGAANVYTSAAFLKTENIELFETIQAVYIEAFFITHSFAAALEAVELCKLNGTVIVFNISGVYLFESHYKEILHMVSVSDIVIGNSNEYREFWKYYSLGKPIRKPLDLREILIELQQVVAPNSGGKQRHSRLRLPIFSKNKTDKIAVCTQGCAPVLCAHARHELLKVETEIIDSLCIKDTTGAGDSFVGGFLAGILRNNGLCESIKLGCWAAGQIIQQIGCSLPSSNSSSSINVSSTSR